MADKKATREAYGEALKEFGAKYDIVVLDADLTKSTKTDTFKKAFPERHINCGIAEGNMMDVAAGIATTGKTVFASSFAMFAAGRAYEQIRNGIGYTHLNVKIGATHAGLSVGEDGATHQCNEDIGLMTTIPGMTVLCPCDAGSTRAAVEAAILHDGPVYLRLGRLAVESIYPADLKLEIGKGNVLREGTDVTLIATGLMVQITLKAAEMLAEQGISARVIDMISLKPIDEELIIKAAKETGCIVTAEEHNRFGGLGSLVSSVVVNNAPVPVRMVAVEDSFGKSGKVPAVLEKFGLTAENIVAKALEAIKAKN
ncbi:MAG: transketolase family protein [Ruminococcaceae bacterium]|nr:transketolase family protein [Oscillospiraceae bacterium]